MAIVIDGKDNSAWRGCSKGFRLAGQGMVVEIWTDAPWSNYNYSGIDIDSDTGSYWLDTDNYFDAWPVHWINKTSNLNDGIITIKLNGTHIKAHYQDLNPVNGSKVADLEYNVWDLNGLGYFMIGAGTSGSSCPNDYRDSAHGINWIMISKDGFSINLIIYNPTNYLIELNNSQLVIENENGVCNLP